MKLLHWLLMAELLHLVQRGGTGRGRSPPRPLLAVPNVTAHPSTASVPITVSLYNGPLLCGFNVAINGLKRWPQAGDDLRGKPPSPGDNLVVLGFTCPNVQSSEGLAMSKNTINTSNTTNKSYAKISRLVGRLGSGPSLVGRIGSGVRVSANFHNEPLD